MISNVTILKPTEMFDMEVIYDIKKSNTLLISKTNPNFYCPVISKYTNVGFRYAYFLWIMRGANLLDQLMYYSDHLEGNTDDGMILRGAYGTRLKFWVGVDQIAEANKYNANIDDGAYGDEFIKPQGIDQLFNVYRDLKEGMDISVANIFDPALDFDETNDIPNLLSMVFKYNYERLDLFATFSEVAINSHFINDYFFLSLLQVCMAGWLECDIGELNVLINKPISEEENLEVCKLDIFEKEKFIPRTDDITFWEDIWELSNIERHLRMMINEKTIADEKVSVTILSETIINGISRRIITAFWQEVGYTLTIYSIIKHGGLIDESLQDFVIEVLETKFTITSVLIELCWWITMFCSEYNNVVKKAEEIINGSL